MEQVKRYLAEQAQGDLLPWSAQTGAAARFDMSLGAVEELALAEGLLPARYQRNRTIISAAQQLQLFRSKVAVIGCGGLGGYILEELARLGVGHMVAVDPDSFEEHNLNRQLLSSPDFLGQQKVAAAAARVTLVNPALTLTPAAAAFGPDNGDTLLAGADVVVDALDSITVRRQLGETCARLGIPLVHGAIAGWYGQIATQFPGEPTLAKVYAMEAGAKGVEGHLGNPSFTPAVVASLQVAEVCKILLGQGACLRGRVLHVDLLHMEFEEISLA